MEYQYHSFNGLIGTKVAKPQLNKIETPLEAKVEAKIEPVVDLKEESDILSPFQCKECVFIGKNDKSLRLHFRKKHVK